MKKVLNYIKDIYKQIFEDRFRNNFILMSIALFAVEVIFRLISGFSIFTWSTVRILFGIVFVSLIITSLATLIRKRWIKNTICIIFTAVASIYAWAQLGFMNYLGVYISFNTTSQFGAIKGYFWDYILSFRWNYYLILIPLVLYIAYLILMSYKQTYQPLIITLKSATIPFVLMMFSFLYYGAISWDFMQNKYQMTSNRELFRYANNPSLAVNQFGVSAFAVLDIKSFLFPLPEETKNFEATIKEVESTRKVSNKLKQVQEQETNNRYLNIHNYLLSQNITDYNEYTGMFKDKNVIVILMESVNDTIINQEYFPNFYKLYSEGWHWNNSYSPRNSCATGNNEFSAMTSLYSLYNSCTSNVYLNNNYFQAIFNLFNSAGYTTNSMHDFTEWYYKRPTIHKNMGSMNFYNAQALDIKTASYYGEWPSDEEFFNKAMDIDDKINGKWMTWLTTVTTHQPYTNSSTYGDLYKDEFKDLGYSTAMSRYLSKMKVLDNAIGILVDRLKTSKELDDTVIVLMADHYPYGLNKSTVAETIEYDLSDYEIERTPFVIYNSKMEPKEFNQYTSYINLVPTLANLMGIEYDPRLYFGHDLLSDDYESLVVFADGSWKNEKAYYNAATGNVKMYQDNAYTGDEIRNITEKVSLKISMSNTAIKINYFDYLNNKINELTEEEKEEVKPEVNKKTNDKEN